MATRHPKAGGRSKPRFDRFQQSPPKLAQPPLEQRQFEPVPRNMFLRDAVPAAMLDRDARRVAYRLEPDVDLGRLIVGLRRGRGGLGVGRADRHRGGGAKGDAGNGRNASRRMRALQEPTPGS